MAGSYSIGGTGNHFEETESLRFLVHKLGDETQNFSEVMELFKLYKNWGGGEEHQVEGRVI